MTFYILDRDYHYEFHKMLNHVVVTFKSQMWGKDFFRVGFPLAYLCDCNSSLESL